MKYRIKNWGEYQHYKDRCPPWIKLHHSLLTSEVWVMGDSASRELVIACMLLASRNNDNDGTFNGDPEYIKRFAYLKSNPNFKPLIEFNFIEMVQDASTLLAQCNTEKSREEQRRGREEAEKIAVADFVLPDWVDRDKWDLWIKTRKGKKMLPEQMQAQIEKLEKWKNAGLDYKQSLDDSAVNGWQGLFEPKSKSAKMTTVDNFESKNYGKGITAL